MLRTTTSNIHSRDKATSSNLKPGVWSRLQGRLIFTFLGLAVVPVLLLLSATLSVSYNQAEQRITAHLQTTAELKLEQIGHWLSDGRETMQIFLAETDRKNIFIDFIKHHASDQAGINQEVNQLLKQFLQNQTDFTELFVYNTNGVVVAASEPAQIGKILHRHSYFSASLNGYFIQAPHYEIGLSNLTMLMTHPLTDSFGHVSGVLAGRANMAELSNIMANLTGLGGTGETYLVSRESGYFVTPSRFIDADYPLKHSYSSLGIEKALNKQQGSDVYQNYLGVEVIGVYRWLPEMQVALLAEMGKAEALGPFALTLKITLAVTLIAALVAMAVGFFSARWIIRPISELTQMARLIEAGDFSQRASKTSLYELELLARAFNRMTLRITRLLDEQRQNLLDLQQAQKEIKRSEERYALAVRGTQDGIWDWNIESNECYFSPRWKEILGYKEDELVNHISSFFDAIHPEHKSLVETALAQHFKQRKPFAIEIKLRCKNTSYRWILIRGEAIYDEQERPLRMAGSATDMTERRLMYQALQENRALLEQRVQQRTASLAARSKELEQMNQRLASEVYERKRAETELMAAKEDAEQARQQAEDASHAKSQFLSNMSHELRTPLNSILGYVQILKQKPDLEKTIDDGLSIIERSGTHLLTLINDILDLARIEAGKMELFPAEMNLLRFLHGILEIIKVQAEQKGLQLLYESDNDLPEEVIIDETRLRQILLNLLSNAVKFTRQGRVSLRVTRRALPSTINKTDQTVIRFIIEDTGIGITPDEIDSIFLPFEQLGDERQRTQGTGLGLAITSQLVSLMGARLLVKSRPDQGCRFWFDLNVITTENEHNKVFSSEAVRKLNSLNIQPQDLRIFPGPDSNHGILPSRDELQQLYEWAKLGRIGRISRRAEELELSDPRYTWFTSQLQELADGFEIKKITLFLQNYIDTH